MQTKMYCLYKKDYWNETQTWIHQLLMGDPVVFLDLNLGPRMGNQEIKGLGGFVLFVM